jgi:purple acid phosphatase-like protein
MPATSTGEKDMSSPGFMPAGLLRTIPVRWGRFVLLVCLLAVVVLLVGVASAQAAHTPEILSVSVGSITKDSAKLEARVNPRGSKTTYRIEYATQSEYEATKAYAKSTATSEVAEDSSAHVVNVTIGALQPETIYAYRAVADNSLGSGSFEGSFTTLSGAVEFGFAGFRSVATNADGSPDLQAGSHPYSLTTAFNLDAAHNEAGEALVAGGSPKDIEVNLPPGFVGDPNVVPKCNPRDFLTILGGGTDKNLCPADTAVGVAHVYSKGRDISPREQGVPIYNLDPPPGTVAEFGFPIVAVGVVMSASVRTGTDNGIRVTLHDLPQSLQAIEASATFWGVPADPVHDSERGECLVAGGTCPTDIPKKAFLTLPTLCSSALTTSIRADSWDAPGRFAEDSYTTQDETGAALPFAGCDRLLFEPSLTLAPDTSRADTPTGMTVDVKANQDGLSSTTGIAPADVQNTQVTLPEGVAVNPGQAAGLLACQPGEDGIGTEAPPSCPQASKVGSVVVTTPLLTDKLEGPVYILPSNPPNLRLLVAPSGDNVNLKLVGDVTLDERTGQVSSRFEGTPPLPFTDLKLSFSGGAQAALATPTGCGVYSTAFDFTPWSAPFGSDAIGTDSFAIDSGPAGSECASPLPFGPSLIAGSTTDQAGGFTNFSLLLQRPDGQQRIEGLRFKTPPGLLGMIRGVSLCGEAEAQSGDCPTSSQIGHVVVGAGPGPYPLYIPEAGRPAAPIYLTGPYEGAPFGLSIVVPVKAGPFDLGRIVTRGAINVDRHTAQITVSTDPLPQLVKGVPADLRTVNAVIDRPGFMFNPTNCDPLSFSGTATSIEGASAPVSSRFQVGSCQSLAFKPNFKVSTSGKTSRRLGASIDAKIVYPKPPPGSNLASPQSNIAKVKVDLPRQLPSRLTTLQKACVDRVFETNPDQCPRASRVGFAKASTPVLASELVGPAYFVSHGSAAFPDLVIVLQGQGIRVDVTGTTFISKKGITSSTFESVPDVPVSSFELTLPQGPNSALAANGDLCRAKLGMPTAFVAHDGATIHQRTPIAITGCAYRRRRSRQ